MFGDASKEDIELYVQSGEPLDKVSALLLVHTHRSRLVDTAYRLKVHCWSLILKETTTMSLASPSAAFCVS